MSSCLSIIIEVNMSYLRYLYLFAHSGVQHILCCVFGLFVFVLLPVSLDCFPVFSNVYSEVLYFYFLIPGFSCLETTIQLRRSIGYYMTELFVPNILIVVLSWVTFWLHPLAVPGRVSLGAVTVLTMSSQGSASSLNAPKVSYVKAVDAWTLFQIIFVFAAMVEFSVVNVLARKKKDMMDVRIIYLYNNNVCFQN